MRKMCSIPKTLIYLCPAVAATHGSLFDVPVACDLFQ